MSDFNGSLPVRTELPGDVDIFLSDSVTPSQKLKILADGSINVNDNGGSITVDATDLDIRDLVFATDKVDVSGSTNVGLDAATLAALESITVQNGAGASAVNVQDGGNSLTVDAVDLDIRDLAFATDKVDVGGSVVALDAPTLAALESITVQNGAGASAVNIQDGGNSITVDSVDLDIRDLVATTDSVSAWLLDEAGVAFGPSNPLYVTNVDGGGTELNDYNKGSAIAAAASSNHDYTVGAGNDLLFKRVWASASGKIKIEVQVDTTGSYVSKAVGFNSTANPNIEIEFAPIQLAATNKIRIIRTNLDKSAEDVYSTIIGVTLA